MSAPWFTQLQWVKGFEVPERFLNQNPSHGLVLELPERFLNQNPSHGLVLAEFAKYNTFCFEKTKRILVALIESQPIIRKKFVPQSDMNNNERHMEILSVLIQRIRGVRRRLQEGGGRLLLHENARPPTTVSVKRFWKDSGFQN
jgi:hypothetical protein